MYTEKDMISFGNFIRDNYYGIGAPKLSSYKPDKYPSATIEEIYVIWSCENETISSCTCPDIYNDDNRLDDDNYQCRLCGRIHYP